MDKNAHPLDYIINCCEQGLVPSTFDILNAKDELKKLRDQLNSFRVIGWARINNYGDLYDPRFYHNPYLDPETVIPIYSDQPSFNKWKNERKS